MAATKEERRQHSLFRTNFEPFYNGLGNGERGQVRRVLKLILDGTQLRTDLTALLSMAAELDAQRQMFTDGTSLHALHQARRLCNDLSGRLSQAADPTPTPLPVDVDSVQQEVAALELRLSELLSSARRDQG